MLFRAKIAVYVSFSFTVMHLRTDGHTDGQILLWRCEDTSKKMVSLIIKPTSLFLTVESYNRATPKTPHIFGKSDLWVMIEHLTKVFFSLAVALLRGSAAYQRSEARRSHMFLIPATPKNWPHFFFPATFLRQDFLTEFS